MGKGEMKAYLLAEPAEESTCWELKQRAAARESTCWERRSPLESPRLAPVVPRGGLKVGPRPPETEFQGSAPGTPVPEADAPRQPAGLKAGPRLTAPALNPPIRAHGPACLPAVWLGP